jgi:hypothetical protein
VEATLHFLFFFCNFYFISNKGNLHLLLFMFGQTECVFKTFLYEVGRNFLESVLCIEKCLCFVLKKVLVVGPHVKLVWINSFLEVFFRI